MSRDLAEAAECRESVSWWEGEYEGNCVLPERHEGHHYDGLSCFDDEGEPVFECGIHDS